MFHKYDFGTASQITSRRWTSESIDGSDAKSFPFVPIILIEVCAIAAVCLVCHQGAATNMHHKTVAHSRHFLKHVG